jgi:hypothetical protein
MEHEVASLDGFYLLADERPAGADHANPSDSSHGVQGHALVTISHLRDCLGVAYLHVVRTGEPVVVQRYGKSDVALVPLWEWRWLKAIEDAIRSGQIDASEFLAHQSESERNMAG